LVFRGSGFERVAIFPAHGRARKLLDDESDFRA
jgi:hypothetical protein